jgi:hypothetical protein
VVGRAAHDVQQTKPRARRQPVGLPRTAGGWVCIWGALAMLTSAPFDDWWHNAYGLDVKIVSPPHMIWRGMIAIEVDFPHSTRTPEPGNVREQTLGLLFALSAILLTMRDRAHGYQHSLTRCTRRASTASPRSASADPGSDITARAHALARDHDRVIP